jgi:hypothetical protein
LLLIPYHVFASSCADEPVTQYFFECLDGVCDGFKAEEEPYRDLCNYTPNVLDLHPNEAESIANYLSVIGKLGEMNGRQQFTISIPTYCAMDVLSTSSPTIQSCTEYDVAHTNVKMQSTSKPLTDLRQEIETIAQAERQEYDRKTTQNMAIGVFIIVFLPLALIIFFSRKDNMLFLAILFGVLGLQMMILCAVTYIGLFNGWPLFTMGLLIFAMILEAIYFIWHQIKRKPTAQTVL